MMKNFIGYRLKQLLEGRLASHSPSNPVGKDPKLSSDNDIARTTHKIISLNNKYGDDPYFQNAHEGDGIYMATIHTNGSVSIKTPNTKNRISDSDIGMLSTGTGGNKHVFIKAYRGIEHPEFKDRKGNVRTSSPANDAAIKTYLLFGKDILDFVKQNQPGENQYTSDEKDFKSQTPDKWQYKYAKFDKEKNQSKSKITMDPDKASEMELKQKELQDKIAKLKLRRGLS